MEHYSIIDMEGYASAIRDGAARSFAEDYSENLDNIISLQQITNLVEQHSLGQDEEGYHLINEEVFDFIFEEVRVWIYEVGLAKLAAKGFVECAWDDEANEMVFWLSDKDKTSISNKPA